MQVALRFVTQRAGARVVSRPTVVEGPSLKVGRSTDCDVHLPDLRLRLHHATIQILDAHRVAVQATEVDGLRSGGKASQRVELVLGGADTVDIGPYRMRLEPSADAIPVSLSFELLDKAPAPPSLDERAVFSMQRAMPSKRALAWLFGLLVLAVYLALPMAYFFGPKPAPSTSAVERAVPPDHVWLSGEMSTAHANLVGDCVTCHEKPFVAVRDQVCLSCHVGIRDHATPDRLVVGQSPPNLVEAGLLQARAAANLPEGRCGSCHREHNAQALFSPRDQGFCVDCHRGLGDRLADTALLSVADFGTDHPEFRPTVVAVPRRDDPELARISLTDKPQDRSGLVFPHRLHVREDGKVAAQARELGLGAALDCGSCHRADAGGVLFNPVEMERDCGTCHSLGFATDFAGRERTLPHGRPKEVIAIIRDYYQATALAEVIGEQPRSQALPIRRPGSAAQARIDDLRETAFARGEAGAADKVRQIFSNQGTCFGCHEITAPTDPDSIEFDVLGVSLADQFMPKAGFVHRSHMTSNLECTTCHAADVSDAATDLLMPGIAICRDCHAGEAATAAIPSSCGTCHWYHGHDDGTPVMTPAGAALAAGEAVR